MVFSGQAVSTVAEHNPVKAELTAADELVALPPGAKEVVADVRALRQVAKLLSELSPVKNVEHPALTPVGIIGFAVATGVAAEVVFAVAFVLAED